jgi:hypothetical protein
MSRPEDSIILKNKNKLCGGWVEEVMQEEVHLDKQSIHDYAGNFKLGYLIRGTKLEFILNK